MSQKSLPEIFAKLPEEYQKYALLEALERMFAAGEWGRLDALFPGLLDMQIDGYFRGQIVSIGVRVASRLRNYDLAFARYGLFQELEETPELAQLKAETLMQLAIQVLPKWSDKLYDMWSRSISPDMPLPAQEITAKTGVLLADAFTRNHNKGMAEAVKDAMQKNLAENVWRRAIHRLAR